MYILTDLDSVSLLDFDPALPCEGSHHHRSLSGHSATEPGAFMVISPCCGPKVIQCSPRVSAMRASGVLWCGTCESEHLTSQYSFVPVEQRA